MKTIIILILLILAGCQYQGYQPEKPSIKERPTVNVPKRDREANYAGGSCVHSSLVSLFRWQGRYGMADYWRRTYSGGESRTGLNKKLEQNGIRWAETSSGDINFLNWCITTRRGCIIVCNGGRHMVTLVDLTPEWACVLDNNKPNTFNWIPRDVLLADWRKSNGWATTVVYAPAAPLP